ncbi:MAG: AMP-binding protein, partial [Myxococcota bacterium]
MAETNQGAVEGAKIPPSPEFAQQAHIKSFEQYQKMYDQSINDPEGFWSEIAGQFEWKEKWSKVREYSFESPVSIKWFLGGKTNVSVNCLDRHLEKRGDQTAIIWEGNTPGEDSKLTYRELYEETCRFANALRELGVKKGDRVAIYMQMIPEVTAACLACARIGAIHSVVFGAF